MRILMVCLGNICRSPLAEGLMKSKIAKAGLDWEVDSAGIGGWHAGDLPDRRSIAVAKHHGIDISEQRARQIRREDLRNFNLILAMDYSNLQQIEHLAAQVKDRKAQVEMILNYVNPAKDRSVPDPYYGDKEDFESVYQLLDEATERVMEALLGGTKQALTP
jgi:protein-tyrosine phosphatase